MNLLHKNHWYIFYSFYFLKLWSLNNLISFNNLYLIIRLILFEIWIESMKFLIIKLKII
jgi:hypothetical protein